VKITFEIPDPMWFRYASIAEDHHVRVGDLLTEQVRQFVHAVENPDVEPLESLLAELSAARRGGWRAPQRGRAARERAEELAWLDEQIRRANLATFQVRDEAAATSEVEALKARRKAGAA